MNFRNIFKGEAKFYIFLAVIISLAYWPITFLQHPMRWDAIDAFLPWRYLLGEFLQNHRFPFWNPYQQAGYPFFADPQASPWYFPIWIIAYFSGYNTSVENLEFIGHIIFAGMGMMFLAKELRLSIKTSFILGFAYALSGFFTGNAQQLYFIISATWLPWVLAYFIRLYDNSHFSVIFKLSIFIYLFISGGYPGFAIIFLYIILIFYLMLLIKGIRRKSTKDFIRFAINSIWVLGLTVVLLLPVILSVYDVFPLLSRASGTNLTQALLHPFSPQCSISFALPYTVVKRMDYFGTDLTMANAYFGWLLFGLMIYGAFIKKSIYFNFFFWIAFISLLISFGSYLPIREWLYYLPGMNLFRFPSLFRLFAILGFLLTAGFVLEKWFACEIKVKRYFLWFLGFSLLGFVLIVGILNGDLHKLNFFSSELFTFSESSSITHNIIQNSVLQILVVTFALIWLFLFRKIKSVRVIGIIVVICIELLLNSTFVQPYSTFDHQFTCKEADRFIDSVGVSGFPIPETKNIIDNIDAGKGKSPFWRNVNIFYKQPAWDGFSSFYLQQYENLESDYPNLHQSALSNPLIFITDTVDIFLNLPDSGNIEPSILFVENGNAISGYYKRSPGDTCYMTVFEPNKIEIKSRTSFPTLLTFLQNFYPGWAATIDGIPVDIHKTNLCFQTVILPAGEHTTIYSFSRTDIFISWVISIFTLFCLLGALLAMNFKKNKKAVTKL